MKVLIKLAVVLGLGFSSINAQNFRIGLDELSSNIDNYTILDARSKKDFDKMHIKNAISFPVSLTFDNLKDDGKILSASKIQKIARKLGLNKQDNIVIYDGGSFFDSSRLFWTLEVYGFKNVRLLDSAYSNWLEKSLAISNKVKTLKPSNYIASVDNKRLATKFATQIATRNPNQIIIDARGPNGYTGKESVAQRFGHIPSALNLPASHNIKHTDKNMAELHKLDTLEKLYSKLDKSKKIIIYCAVGKISSTNYFALRELGFDVANYDASWKQWGNTLSLPIVNLSAK